MWEVLSIQEAVREARAEANPVLAAKRIQDLGQAYGAEDNISIIILRLTKNAIAQQQQQQQETESIGRLLRELKNAVRIKSSGSTTGSTSPIPENTCTCPCCLSKLAGDEASNVCCCHAAAASNDEFYLNGVLRNVLSSRLV